MSHKDGFELEGLVAHAADEGTLVSMLHTVCPGLTVLAETCVTVRALVATVCVHRKLDLEKR